MTSARKAPLANAARSASIVSERSEWRAVAGPLAILLSAFGAGWLYAAQTSDAGFGWPVAMAYGIALAWLARALMGSMYGSVSSMSRTAVDEFRQRAFWSRPARWSYAALLVCDGLFLLESNPAAPGVFLIFAAASSAFSIEVGVLSLLIGAWQLM